MILIPACVGGILFVFRIIFSKLADQFIIFLTVSMQEVSLQAVNIGRQEDNLEWNGSIADGYGTKNSICNQQRSGVKIVARDERKFKALYINDL